MKASAMPVPSLCYNPQESPRRSDILMIKVIVLGTAQDAGVPQLGCRDPYCERARIDPRLARWVASLALIDTETRRSYLIDATPDVRPQLDYLMHHPDYPARADRNPVDGIVLTH